MFTIRAVSSVVIVAVLCGTAVHPGAAQDAQQPPPSPEAPIFRGAINAVRVDVIVTDEDGRPITDLTIDDFDVLEDGAPQEIADFEIVRIGESAKEYRPPDIRSPLQEEAEALRDDVRLFLIYMSFGGVNLSRAAAARILEPLVAFVRSLDPADMVGIMDPFTPLGAVMLTRDREGLVRSIRAYGDEQVRQRREMAILNRDLVIRPYTPVEGLEAASRHLASLRDGRQSIIFVGSAVTGRERSFGGSGALTLEFSELLTTLNRNNTAVYVLDPAGLTTGRSLGRAANLRAIAEQTGGQAIVDTNEVEAQLARIAEDARFHYLLSYDSPAPADGKFHEITVRVRRPGAHVRARAGYWAFSTTELLRAAARAAEIDRPVQNSLASIASARAASRAVQTWVGTARGSDGQTRVTFVWEPQPPSDERTESPARVSLVARDAAGGVLFEGASPDTGGPLPETGATPPRYRITFEAPPGPVDLRASVESAGGDLLDHETHAIELPDYATAEATVSTPRVFMGRTIPQLRAQAADADAVPAAGREFMRSDRLLIRFDTYGEAAAPRAALLNRSGGEMSSLDVVTAERGGTHQVELGLSHVPPGEYLIEIVATPDGAGRQLVPLRIRG